MTPIKLGLVGAGWMGRAYAAAFRNASLIFGRDPAAIEIVAVADASEAAAKSFAETFGVARWTTDWRQLVADPAVQVVDITAPNDVHPAIAIAAVKAGKHVYCEKPMANSAAD